MNDICSHCGPNCEKCKHVCNCKNGCNCIDDPESMSNINLDLYGFGKLSKYSSKNARKPRILLPFLHKFIKPPFFKPYKARLSKKLIPNKHVKLPDPVRVVRKKSASPKKSPSPKLIKGYDPNLLSNRIILANKISRHLEKEHIPSGKACVGTPIFMKKFIQTILIGKGGFGMVWVVKFKVSKLILSAVIKQTVLSNKEVHRMKKLMYPKEYLYNTMINDILKTGICPNFNFTYSIMFCDTCDTSGSGSGYGQTNSSWWSNSANSSKNSICALVLAELQDTDMSTDLSISDNKFNYLRQLSMLFQILAAVHTIHTVYGMAHNDIKADNILVKKIQYNPGEYWKYTLDNVEYYVPNTGIMVFLSDFGLSQLLKPSKMSNYYGIRNSEIVSSTKGLKFKPFTTEWFPVFKKGIITPISSPEIKTSKKTHLTMNMFVKNFNSNSSIDIDLNNTKRFPPYEFYRDINDVIRCFIGGSRQSKLKGLSYSLKTDLQRYTSKLKALSEWPDKDIILFSADRTISKIFDNKFTKQLPGNLLDTFKLPFVEGKYRTLYKEAFSNLIMNNVFWSFLGDTFSTQKKFVEAVRQYYLEIKDQDEEDEWNPDELAIPRAEVRIQYMYWRNGKPVKRIVLLLSDNGKSFSQGELLYKIHNKIVNDLRGLDSIFFEGLEQLKSSPKEPPLYSVILGS